MIASPCPVCGAPERKLVSSTKLICLACGYLPSCANAECGL